MFGRRFWGRRFFGPRFWGSGGNLAPPASVACEYAFTNFEANAIGTTPVDGWTKRGTSTDHSMTPVITSPPFKRRAVTLASSDSTATAFSLDAVDDFGDSEDVGVLVCIYRPASSAHDAINLYVRSTGTPGQDGYQAVISWADDTLYLFKNVANVNTEIDSASLTHPAGTWKLYRFRVDGTSPATVRAKAWDTGDREPSSWDVEVADASSPITGSGWVGLGGFIGSGSASSKINFVSVASGGCAAYLPVMNAAFDDWLDTPNERCFLGDFPAIGYDALGDPPTKTVYARASNMGFNTDPWDDPPNYYYRPLMLKAPTFKREMSTFSGRVASGLGAVIIDNGAKPELGEAGARDDWQRVKWKRDYTRIRLGDPTWSKHDFRDYVVGRMAQPIANPMNQLSITLADLSDAFFTTLLQQNRFESGPNINRYKPMVIGAVAYVDLPVISQADLTFQMNDGAIEGFVEGDVVDGGDGIDFNWRIFDNGAPLFGVSFRFDEDDVSDTLAPHGGGTHGFANGYTFVWTFTGAPTGFDPYTRYYLVNTTSTDFQLAATPGGSPIDVGASATPSDGFAANVYAYQIDYDLGILELQTQPTSSRITAGLIMQAGSAPVADFDDSAGRVQAMLEWVIFTQGGISEEFKDSESFDALGDLLDPNHAAGVYLSGREQANIGNTLDRITKGTNTFCGVAPDGLIYVGLIDLPTDEPVDSFTDSEVVDLHMTQVTRPIDFSTSDVTYAPTNFDQGPLTLKTSQGDPVGYLADKTFLAPYDYGAGLTPLDDHPEIADAKAPQTFDLIYVSAAATEQQRLANLYKRAIGTFQFRTKLRAAFLRYGATIELDHPRLGWKEYDGMTDPISPDTDEDFDARKAVVVGIEGDPNSKDPFPVTVTVFRQIPGYYPTGDLN